MLRRKPTALTISPEDLAAFEDAHTRRLALVRFKKTGEDPNGWFTGDMRAPQQTTQRENRAQALDPNDELKPLPGDKARIVRSREERIMGNVAGGR